MLKLSPAAAWSPRDDLPPREILKQPTMPQFVLLHHRLPADSARADHYDLMLEDGDSLLTWAIAALPGERPQVAEELPRHRMAYLTHEGPVSNNRGQVKRVAAGSFEWLQRADGEWIVELNSPALSGKLHLQRQDEKTWQLWLG